MNWDGVKIRQHLSELQMVTNNLADVIYAIRTNMQGKGVSPADSQRVMAKLNQVESRLRELGGNVDMPIPNLQKIEPR